MQATESSTGVRHDVGKIAELALGSDALLVVDAITGLGSTDLDVDELGVDIIIGGSQKALMVPPGMAYLAVSERAWKRMEAARQPRYYFDLARERKAAARGEASFTPATALIVALGAALDYLATQGGGSVAEGRRSLVNNAETCAAMTRAAAQAMNLRLFAQESPAAALTAIQSPAGVESGDIVTGLKTEYGAVVANGQGEMKGKLFRIAHLGYFDYMDTIAVIGALEHVLRGLGEEVELGKGLAGAQREYSRRQSKAATAS